jgi:hypothetical protein
LPVLFKGKGELVSFRIEETGGRTYAEQEGEKDEEDFDRGTGLGAVLEELKRNDRIVTKGNWSDSL